MKRQDAAHEVGARVREIRRATGISQMDLAELATMHFSNIGKIERGQANPSLSTLARIATALDTTVAELTSGVTAVHVPARDRQVTVRDLLRAREEQLARDAEPGDAEPTPAPTADAPPDPAPGDGDINADAEPPPADHAPASAPDPPQGHPPRASGAPVPPPEAEPR
ncbi:helix-turn-helix domain-containing protein [Leucobacter sp. M11]|uniref:helix-turn-helix domain-containing protein n=1 Tax=Leucobacter sp. M11 TaxID=2993565 RepID=UPI002D7F61B7|nr:helix-turn-helix domain-containing protein [Leucobacter sp. M11]MEB4614630.1 helix-turn-helix domain-containing protein [Leucobacter sp. M11]